MTTVSSTCSYSSETSACSGWVWIGSRSAGHLGEHRACGPPRRGRSGPPRSGPSDVSTATARPSRPRSRSPRSPGSGRRRARRPRARSPRRRSRAARSRRAAGRSRRAPGSARPARRSRIGQSLARPAPARATRRRSPFSRFALTRRTAVAHVLQRVREVEHAALAEEQVVVELRLEPLPQLQRVLVDRGALVPEVVRADDGRVARDVAAGEPARSSTATSVMPCSRAR